MNTMHLKAARLLSLYRSRTFSIETVAMYRRNAYQSEMCRVFTLRVATSELPVRVPSSTSLV